MQVLLFVIIIKLIHSFLLYGILKGISRRKKKIFYFYFMVAGLSVFSGDLHSLFFFETANLKCS